MKTFKRLVKTFEEENNFNNIIVPLTVDVEEVVFVYHHNVDRNKIKNCTAVIKKYKNIKLSYHMVDENEVNDMIDEDTIIDISAAKYLSIVLYEVALKNNLDIIYYDEHERVIKRYKDHKVIYRNIFKLTIEDIVKSGGGVIESEMHKPVEDRESIELIYNAVETASSQYSSFISYVSRINSYISDYDHSGNTFYLKNETIVKIVSDDQYKKYINLKLFEIEDNKLIFANEEIRKVFMVSGEFLENYIYHKLLDSNIFDDVKMSVSIEFNDEQWKYPVKCEIDCIVLKDNNLLFTSIKSNKVDTADLNEIKVHNVMFGNNQSKPVICINNDLSSKRPSVYAKAEELGVYVIDEDTFVENDISKQFLSIIDDTYQYEEL